MRQALIADVFAPVVLDLARRGHREYWLKGGRGSTKSSFISIEIVRGIYKDPEANAIVYRRYGNTLKDSVFEQLIWAIDMLGMSDEFKVKTSPLEIKRPKTGQRIIFRGADDPMKSKSIKLSKGYFKYLWFEELAEFKSYEDIRTIKQSVLRGSRQGFTICSYNPPRSAQSWVNAEVLIDNPSRYVHSSTYLDVAKNHIDWIGEQFVTDAETLKQTNERAYRNEYLGEVTGNGGQVFENVTVREIPKAELDTFEWFYNGIDWGWFPDPFQWVRCAYNSKKRILYIVDSCRLNKCGNKTAYDTIKDRLNKNEPLHADSAEPKSIADFKEYGAWWCRAVTKGVGSVAYSTKWLASLTEIVIDTKCSDVATEFVQYEYEKNSHDEYISTFVDKNNHAIDAVRYAMYPVWKYRGE